MSLPPGTAHQVLRAAAATREKREPGPPGTKEEEPSGDAGGDGEATPSAPEPADPHRAGVCRDPDEDFLGRANAWWFRAWKERPDNPREDDESWLRAARSGRAGWPPGSGAFGLLPRPPRQFSPLTGANWPPGGNPAPAGERGERDRVEGAARKRALGRARRLALAEEEELRGAGPPTSREGPPIGRSCGEPA